MRKRIVLALLILTTTTQVANSQIGGRGAYSFLNLPFTPRSAALGSKVAALDEADAGVVLINPAHLSYDLHNHIELSYVSYFAGIQYGLVSYSRNMGKAGMFGLAIQHVNYGKFIEADATGQITGSFSGSDMALNIIYAKTFDSLVTVGINLKPIYSHLEIYKSFGICADIGISFNSRDKLFAAGLTARNIGTMLKPYTPNTRENLPFEIIASVSQKLQHAPFRFVGTFQQLQTTHLHYARPENNTTFFGDDTPNSPSVFERIGKEAISHLIIGVEFVPIKSFYLRGGYNFQRRNELKIEQRTSFVGFSWGIGVNIKNISINYSRATYHLAGASNHFSISTNLSNFL